MPWEWLCVVRWAWRCPESPLRLLPDINTWAFGHEPYPYGSVASTVHIPTLTQPFQIKLKGISQGTFLLEHGNRVVRNAYIRIRLVSSKLMCFNSYALLGMHIRPHDMVLNCFLLLHKQPQGPLYFLQVSIEAALRWNKVSGFWTSLLLNFSIVTMI